jgi:hypothetical protein
MFLRIFDNRLKFWLYLFGWLLFALLQTITASSIVHLAFTVLLVDALIHSILYVLTAILLWYAIKYSNVSSLSVFQITLNYLVFFVLALALSLGLGYGFETLLGNEIVVEFSPFLPVRALLTLFVYIIVIQFFKLNSINNLETNKMQNEADDGEQDADGENLEGNEILERIAVKSGQKIHVILVSDILYIQSDGDYVHIVTLSGKYMKELTMKYLNESLPAALFVRVHRSYIVNVEAISRIELYEKQTQQLTLKNGDRIKVSQAGYKLLKEKLNL